MTTFKTPEEFGVSKEQFCAIMMVAEKLQNGSIRHYKNARYNHGFDMSTWCGHYNCGTVCCIGGWAETLGEVNLMRMERLPGLESLFFPYGWGRDWRKIKPEHAAEAILNWARTGDPGWEGIGLVAKATESD